MLRDCTVVDYGRPHAIEEFDNELGAFELLKFSNPSYLY